ncbi:MAG: hypothetical protein JNN12_12555 [Bacteroidetes Order II. Incertae sedis bacterium]|nr:hypothetical protein [Bacteroidetes Order II. bacterium]
MNRNRINRILLVVLALLGVGVVIRSLVGTTDKEGFLVWTNIPKGQLYHQTVEVARPVEVQVDARGSFEKPGVLATYGWIVNQLDHSVVWQMTPQNTKLEQGQLGRTVSTFTLPKGVYSVYYSSYGDSQVPAGERTLWAKLTGDDDRAWFSEAERWYMAIKTIRKEQAVDVRLMEYREETSHRSDIVNLQRQTGFKNERFNFEVKAPSRIHVLAMGDYVGRFTDFAKIAKLDNGELVWKMSYENTKHAGGSLRNRLFEGEIWLQPGIYQVLFESDMTHHYTGWEDNPPLNPTAWGVRMRAVSGYEANIGELRPFDRPLIAGILRPGDDADLVQRFSLQQKTGVYIHTMGEYTDGEIFDKGWLENEAGVIVWEPDISKARDAGGNPKNRQEDAFITLDAGVYQLRFKSDGSHSYNKWNVDPPENKERWGVSIYALASDAVFSAEEPVGRGGLDEVIKDVLDGARDAIEDVRGSLRPKNGALGENERVLVNLIRIGNQEAVSESLELMESRNVLRIIALGENEAGRWRDYGWIEDADGRKVWEMRMNETVPAGGDNRNRLFDGKVILKAGTYRVHYQSNGSHAFGDFSFGSPDSPAGWGIRIVEVQE